MLEQMDNYWYQLITAVFIFGLLAILIERALYQVFDSKGWGFVEEQLDKRLGGDFWDLKPWISVAVCVTLVIQLKLDMLALMFQLKEPHDQTLSFIITGLFVAGGSTGIYKLLRQARQLKEATMEKQLAELKFSAAPADVQSTAIPNIAVTRD